MRLFTEYWWPGNVRELQNCIKRMVILGSDEPIRRELAAAIARRSAPPEPIPALRSNGTPAGAFSTGVPAAPAPPPVAVPAAPTLIGTLKDIGRRAARDAERELLARTLQQTRWNRREAAEILGISYKALLYKIKDSELDKAS
jgi:two-component system, NtrC family, response regulator AtoC